MSRFYATQQWPAAAVTRRNTERGPRWSIGELLGGRRTPPLIESCRAEVPGATVAHLLDVAVLVWTARRIFAQAAVRTPRGSRSGTSRDCGWRSSARTTQVHVDHGSRGSKRCCSSPDPAKTATAHPAARKTAVAGIRCCRVIRCVAIERDRR